MENLISIITAFIYLIPSLLIFIALIILIKKDSHYSIILMLISTSGKLLTDLCEFLTVTSDLVHFKTDFLISFFKILQSTSMICLYMFGIGFLIFMIRLARTSKNFKSIT